MTYVAYKTKEKLVIDGKLNEKAWELAPKSPRFVDIVTGGPALYDTRSAVLWDEEHLYIGFWIEEPFVKGELSERDSLLFNENDVEIFIDGGDTYYELEINALNTIYEVFFIWQDAYKRNGKYDVPEFDLYKRDAYTFGGNHDRHGTNFRKGTHPRGIRYADPDWDLPGLKTGVHVDGKINDDTHVDKGWTVEFALPWKGMKWLADGRSLPPREGDEWGIQFARYQKLLGLNGLDKSVGWAWDPIGSDDNHRPEKFTSITFSEKLVEELA